VFRIGEFAKISQVAIKTLRYYDDIALFKPASVDADSGYRYYTLEQLPRLNRILALKDLGFSLEQIALLLDESFVASELRGMLRMKRAELQQTLQTEQARLDRVEARLKLIENETPSPQYDIVLKRVEPLNMLCGRQIIASSEEVDDRCRLLGISIYRTIISMAIKDYGPMLTIYHDEEDYTGQDHDLDIEMGVVMTHAIQSVSLPNDCGLGIRELVGADCAACMVYSGPYEGLWQVYGYMLNWIDTHQYTRSGPFRFVYLRTVRTEGDPIIELQFPLEQKKAKQEE
jgi:DNA-binding transcriptional MerR regulator/effector-binding domain-containing protein